MVALRDEVALPSGLRGPVAVARAGAVAGGGHGDVRFLSSQVKRASGSCGSGRLFSALKIAVGGGGMNSVQKRIESELLKTGEMFLSDLFSGQ